MSEKAILVDKIGKRYRIGLRDELDDTLLGALGSWARRPLENFRRLRGLSHFGDADREARGIFWALEDVSFDVGEGEVVGLIGRNGAGKSTLLKILCGITEPTCGHAEISGRVASLLEVGTGFHPELTGRENIFLNGALLGMKRTEIQKRFDEIVAFAEVDQFLDTPVKRYSSGMSVRLAFAVAAHLEPDVLLIDEVLAVGDAGFQRKCLNKLDGVAQDEGRTVIFVSHNAAAVKSLCNSAVWLESGRVREIGKAGDVVDRYLDDIAGEDTTEMSFAEEPAKEIQILKAATRPADDPHGADVVLDLTYVVRGPCEDAMLCVDVQNSSNVSVYYANDDELYAGGKRQAGLHECSLRIPLSLFAPGRYQVAFGFWQIGRKTTLDFPRCRLTCWRKDEANRLARHGIRWPSIVYQSPEWTWRRA